MSVTAFLCRVCQEVSIEGDPESVSCDCCGFWFHDHCSCAPNLESADAIYPHMLEVEDGAGNEVDSDICPICQGRLVLIEDANEIWGYVKALELAGVRELTKETCKPLVTLPNFPLKLDFITELNSEVAKMLAERSGSLSIGVEDQQIRAILTNRLNQKEADDPEISWPPDVTQIARNPW